MNIYSIPPLVISVCFLILGSFVYLRGRTQRTAAVGFFISSFVTFWWQFNWFFLLNSNDLSVAKLLAKSGHIGIALLPASLFHYYSFFIDEKNYSKYTRVFYLVSGCFIALLVSDLFIDGVRRFEWGYYPSAGRLHPFFLAYLFSVAAVCGLGLYRKGQSIGWKGLLGEQLKLLTASFCIYCLAATDFLVNYGYGFYPLGIFAIFLSLCISAYAIVKYRLMDIRVAVAATGIFLTVYAVALGIPFYLYQTGQHFAALIVAVVLATAAPFIYARLRREAEERILKDQQIYHDVLIRSAQELTRIKDVPAIAQFVVDSLAKAGHPLGVAFYSKEDGRFARKAFIGKDEHYPATLAGHFEMQPSNWDNHVLLPLSRAGEVIGNVVLGNKADNELWTERELISIRALLDQAALALENAVYVEDLQRTQNQLIESEKMATIGFLVGGLAHQLKNRLTPLVFNAEFAARKIESSQGTLSSSDCHETLTYLQKISDGVESSKEVINGILNYASDRETKTDVELKRLVAASIELIQFKIKPDTVVFENNIDHNIPPAKGNFAQLQEVFFNIIDNAYHSMMEKKVANHDTNYQPRMTFSAKLCKGGFETLPYDSVAITVTDNGLGVKEEHLRKLFTPLFSTKSKTKQGHGLGLYVMKQIIEKNHGGRIHFSSEYGQGVEIAIHIPVTL